MITLPQLLPAGLKPAETLLALSDIEVQVARFYERLAEMFDDHQALSRFWLDLADEEFDHADALCTASETLVLFEFRDWDQVSLLEPRIIKKLTRDIEQCEEEMTRHENSLNAAFECALFLESSELNSIYSWLLDEVPVLWTKTLSMMKANPGEHIVKLCRVIEHHAQDERLRKYARNLKEQWEEYGRK